MTNIYEEYQNFVPTTFAYSGDTRLDTYHCLIGILGEHQEYLNEVRVLKNLFTISPTADHSKQLFKVHKEIGDMCYYTCMLCVICDIEFKVCSETLPNNRTLEELQDAFKRYISYNHLDAPTETTLKQWLCALWNIAFETGLNLEYFAQQNMDKLRKRYPSGKFDSNDAANKKDEK